MHRATWPSLGFKSPIFSTFMTPRDGDFKKKKKVLMVHALIIACTCLLYFLSNLNDLK